MSLCLFATAVGTAAAFWKFSQKLSSPPIGRRSRFLTVSPNDFRHDLYILRRFFKVFKYLKIIFPATNRERKNILHVQRICMHDRGRLWKCFHGFIHIYETTGERYRNCQALLISNEQFILALTNVVTDLQLKYDIIPDFRYFGHIGLSTSPSTSLQLNNTSCSLSVNVSTLENILIFSNCGQVDG